MSESDIAAKALLVKYNEKGTYYYMHKDSKGNIVGLPKRVGALLFTPKQAKEFINHMIKIKFPFKCGPEAVK